MHERPRYPAAFLQLLLKSMASPAREELGQKLVGYTSGPVGDALRLQVAAAAGRQVQWKSQPELPSMLNLYTLTGRVSSLSSECLNEVISTTQRMPESKTAQLLLRSAEREKQRRQ